MIPVNAFAFTVPLVVIVRTVNTAVISTEMNGTYRPQSDSVGLGVGEARYGSLQNNMKHVSMQSELKPQDTKSE